MESSREYYEDKLADYQRYRRGRNLYQFCKDEGIDYNWFLRAQRMFGTKPKNKKRKDAAKEEEAASNQDFIRLHYIDDTDESPVSSDTVPSDDADSLGESSVTGVWRIGDVTLTDPDGNEIIIRCGSAAALVSFLSKLTLCHD